MTAEARQVSDEQGYLLARGALDAAAVARLIERLEATIAAGERPADLTDDERVAYDMAAALNRGGVLPETTYRASVDSFGEQGAAEIVFLVGCFSMVAVTLNAFDAAVPGET